jgi:hypothetical protein
MNLKKHIWKIIPNYENYKINQKGKVINITRNTTVKPYISKKGYLNIKLSKNNKVRTFGVHQLVAIAFLNHTPSGMLLVVNHIDFNKLNNNVNNLEIVSNRVNTSKNHLKSTSKYTGVYYNKINKSWIADISINGKSNYLGSFKTEEEANQKYLQYLNEHL